MGDYNRSTRELELEEMPAETMDAIQKHLERYNLGALLDNAMICVETRSDKIKKGLFSGPGKKLVVSTVILTPRWLIQLLKFNAEPVIVQSARLPDIVVSDYENSQFYSTLPDTGVNVSGRFTDTGEDVTVFFGLGKDAAGEKFKSTLIEAVQKAKG